MDLLTDPREGWTLLTLNRPAARNALNTALLAELAEALDRLATDPACRVAVLTG
ncbi:MAG: enoyl-CoA hydratase-related protein, partial [Anaerolineae bacterium]|nr:enoyl-CoA hydratase-related protein [Anaerolineae bacterium]